MKINDILYGIQDKSGTWEFDSAFDVNQADVTGQSLLYLAVCVCSVKIVELLLNYRVKARKAAPEPKELPKVINV